MSSRLRRSMLLRSTLLLLGVLWALLGVRCGGPLKTILLDEPSDGMLLDDPGAVVVGSARVGSNFDASTIEVRLDGIDLVAALGLTPPFSAQAGMVMIGPDLVGVSDFSFTTAAVFRIDLVASGLPFGSHSIDIEGERSATGVVVTRTAGFEILEPLSQVARELPAAGHGPLDAGSEGTLMSGSLGQPLAAPPVPLPSGGEVRSGFVHASQAFAGGSP